MFTKLKSLKSRESEKGFTIIEVMIVLAIAGLILLIVFLAVPALQRSARNTQRKNDAAAVGAAVANYIANNGGGVPDLITGPANGIVTLSCDKNGGANGSTCDNTDANTETAKVGLFSAVAVDTTAKATDTAPDTKTVELVPGWNCNNSNSGLGALSARSAAILYQVESGTSAVSNQCVEQ